MRHLSAHFRCKFIGHIFGGVWGNIGGYAIAPRPRAAAKGRCVKY